MTSRETMTQRKLSQILRALLVLSLSGLCGCSMISAIWPPYAKLTIIADKRMNPDINQRPSPVQIKVLELSSRNTFDNLDFESLFYQGKTLLSDELLSEVTLTIQPEETLLHRVNLHQESSFIAVLSAYRNIDGARWKHIYEVKPHGHYKHTITLTHNAIRAGDIYNTKKTKRQKKSRNQYKQQHNRPASEGNNQPQESDVLIRDDSIMI
jgi:type VI secretion system protein VasD